MPCRHSPGQAQTKVRQRLTRQVASPELHGFDICRDRRACDTCAVYAVVGKSRPGETSGSPALPRPGAAPAGGSSAPTAAGPPPPIPTARHVAIIMDGNGRWAQQRGLLRLEGHKQGAHAVRDTVRAARQMGLSALTLYAFSEQNWGRPLDEVSGLMQLLHDYIVDERSGS